MTDTIDWSGRSLAFSIPYAELTDFGRRLDRGELVEAPVGTALHDPRRPAPAWDNVAYEPTGESRRLHPDGRRVSVFPPDGVEVSADEVRAALEEHGFWVLPPGTRVQFQGRRRPWWRRMARKVRGGGS